MLPEKRVLSKYPFAVTGITFVGLFHLKKGKQETKGYNILSSCDTFYFTATRTMEMKEFIDKLNGFMAFHSRPQEITSENAKTFQATAKFIEKLRKNEELHAFLADQGMKWEFILSKSPWRGGFYERLNKDLKRILLTLGPRVLTPNSVIHEREVYPQRR